jgi:tRNA-5-methyluridine54 2-sulfurtransferase
MKCKTCGGKATVNMRQHKLALCSPHYLEWVPQQVARAIKKYWMFGPDERVLVAVSGGKDSLSLWDILHNLGYQADGLYLGLGIDEGIGYSDESQRLSQKFADERGLKLHVVDIEKEYGASIPVLAENSRRGHGRPCAVCGVAKRHEMNRIARDMGYDVLATGHNLDDEVAVLFANTLSWSADLLRRQEPVLRESDGLARKVKPLCRFYEKEMAAYALLRNIEYVYDECPFSLGSTSIYYKELLNRLENERPGAKLAFYVKFLEAKKKGLFTPATEKDFVLTECPKCGQPTSGDGLCSFCKIMGKV